MNDRKRMATGAGSWLDDDFDEDLGERSAGGDTGKDRVGDDATAAVHWIHGLLASRADGHDAAQSRRIRAVCEALGDSSRVPEPRSLPWRFVRVVRSRVARRSLTAVVVAATLLLFLFSTGRHDPRTALASVQRAARAWSQPVSRVYRVRVSSADGGTARWSGRVTVNGGDRFVLELNAPVMGEILVGSDGASLWWLFPKGPVFVGKSDPTGGSVLPRIEAPIDTQFLRLDAVLQRLAEDFVVRQEDVAEDESLIHIVARRKEGRSWRLPRSVDVWSHRRTGVIERVVMARDRAAFLVLPHTITLELIGPSRHGLDWFDHERHHAAGRPVRQVDSAPNVSD